jgi:phenylpropionate dioxygenase-like ring-hydroxylating dioxygenase large terminal subunit
MLGLTKYHADRCGELIFVSLADNPVPLKEFLGSAFEKYEQLFSPEMHTAIALERTIEANWKVCVENALETYHTSEVHPHTFGTSPDEEDCTHELDENWTSMTISYEREKSFRQKLDAFGNWLVGKQPTKMYQHALHYPHVMMTHMSLYSWFETLLPFSPTSTLSVIRVLCHIGPAGSLRRVWNRYLISRWPKTFLMQVGAEDAAVLPYVQRGLQSADEPLGGLISTREERVFHFQRYIQKTTQPTHSVKLA